MNGSTTPPDQKHDLSVGTTTRVTQRDAEIQQLKTRIEAMQETLTQWENAIQQANPAPQEKSTVSSAHPCQAAAALTAAARLTKGDPSIWKTVRALKLRPDTLRIRIVGDYRLLFEIGQAETLRIVDIILRRDLDRWLAAACR